MGAMLEYVLKQQERAEKRKEEKRIPLRYLKKNIQALRQFCEDEGQDATIIITGNEGSGKSTLGSHVAQLWDHDFNLEESMIYDFRGQDGYLEFLQKYQDVPGKVAMFDEAVSVLFSQNSNSRDVKEALKIFKINRDCNHCNILIAPSFFDMHVDIRERRSKIVLYTYIEIEHLPGSRKNRYNRKFAYFSAKKIVQLSQNRKIKQVFRSPKDVFKFVRPDFIETFPGMDVVVEHDYLHTKRDFRRKLIDEMANGEPAEKKEKIKEKLLATATC